MNKKTAKKIAKRYEAELEVKLEQAETRTHRFQIQAELEDIEDGHWDGPRTDEPPANWWDSAKTAQIDQLLERLVQVNDPVHWYRIQAEMEDIENDRWNGPRTDAVPLGWFESHQHPSAYYAKLREGGVK
jgi:hypothetical protein